MPIIQAVKEAEFMLCLLMIYSEQSHSAVPLIENMYIEEYSKAQ